MKNTEQRYGFLNRYLTKLPDHKCNIKVIVKDYNCEYIHLCEWKPFDKSQYTGSKLPSKGYLGTATVIEGKYIGIGFHAWEQNNSEFVYYQLV